MFGLVNRNCSNFDDPLILKCLYTQFIRFQHEYALNIWETFNIGCFKQIEKIHNKII